MNGNVLVFCPTFYRPSTGELALDGRTKASVEALRWDGEITVKFSTFNPFPIDDEYGRHPTKQLENVLAQYRAGRVMCLEGGYDAILTVEHDMLLPVDALSKLWGINKPVAYGVYMLRHGPPRLNTWRYINGPGVGMSLSIFPDELKVARRQVVARVSGVGFGCCLIRREILEQFDFHPSENGGHPSPDVPFSVDLQKAKIEQWAHFDVVCGHIMPGGEPLWPEWINDRKGITVNKRNVYIALADFNGQVGNQLMQFTHGDEYQLPELEAAEWVRAGYLQIKTEPPKKQVRKKQVHKKVVPKKPEPEKEPESEG